MINKKNSLQKQKTNTNLSKPESKTLLEDLRHMIDKTRQSIASAVNAGLTLLYWHAGNRIHREILKEERAEYGKSIIATISQELVLDYGNGFTEKNLRRMIQFAEVFPDEQIVVSLIR